MASENAETAATAMERTMNTYGGMEDADFIVRHFCSMHRTTNQSFVSRIILPFVRQMAVHYDTGVYDGRNEAACRICRKMWDAVKENLGIEDDTEEVRLPMI